MVRAAFARLLPVAGGWRNGGLALQSGHLQQPDEFFLFVLREMPQQLRRKQCDDLVHLRQQRQARFRDVGPENAPVVPVAVLADEVKRLEPGQESGNVRDCGYYAFTNGRTSEAIGVRAAQNAQNVVLRCRDPPGSRGVLKGALKTVSRAHQVEDGLFSRAGKRLILRDLSLEAGQQ